jgi:hypothetical protein
VTTSHLHYRLEKFVKIYCGIGIFIADYLIAYMSL